MKVFVIRKSEHFAGEESTVEAVPSSLEKAKAYVCSRGEVREWPSKSMVVSSLSWTPQTARRNDE